MEFQTLPSQPWIMHLHTLFADYIGMKADTIMGYMMAMKQPTNYSATNPIYLQIYWRIKNDCIVFHWVQQRFQWLETIWNLSPN